MKKSMKRFVLIWAIFLLAAVPQAFAGGSVDANLTVTIPCVDVGGSFYDVQLLKFDHPSDPNGLYWQVGPGINTATDDGDCGLLDLSTLDLTLTNLDVMGSLYDVLLYQYDCAQYPNDLFFTLGSAVPVASGSSFTLSTTSFTAGGEIPLTHVCDTYGGSDISPELSWSGAPAATASYALIMDDEDPPCGTGSSACKHWSVYNIPVSESGFAQGVDISGITGAVEGEAYTGDVGYAGPCPPNQHTYTFKIYALSDGATTMPSGYGMTRATFEATFSSYILDSAVLTGTFTP